MILKSSKELSDFSLDNFVYNTISTLFNGKAESVESFVKLYISQMTKDTRIVFSRLRQVLKRIIESVKCTYPLFDVAYAVGYEYRLGMERNAIICGIQRGWVREHHLEQFRERYHQVQMGEKWALAEYLALHTPTDHAVFEIAYARELRDYYRQTIQREQELQNRRNINIGHRFGGAHNVHMLDKQRSSFLEWLCKEVPSVNHDYVKEVVDKMFGFRGAFIEIAYNEIYESTHGFMSEGVPYITMKDIFERICCFIYKSPNTDLIVLRLCDELEDMTGTCLSGHVNRLFNALQGFMPTYSVVTKHTIKNYIQDELNTVMKLIQKIPETLAKPIYGEHRILTDRDRVYDVFEEKICGMSIKEETSEGEEESINDLLMDQMMDQEYSGEILEVLQTIGDFLYELVLLFYGNEKTKEEYKRFVSETMEGYFKYTWTLTKTEKEATTVS
jgi:hypothetical protein